MQVYNVYTVAIMRDQVQYSCFTHVLEFDAVVWQVNQLLSAFEWGIFRQI